MMWSQQLSPLSLAEIFNLQRCVNLIKCFEMIFKHVYVTCSSEQYNIPTDPYTSHKPYLIYACKFIYHFFEEIN